MTAFGDPSRPDTGVLSLSFDNGPRINCAGYTELTPDTALFFIKFRPPSKGLPDGIIKIGDQHKAVVYGPVPTAKFKVNVQVPVRVLCENPKE